jgi:hypothetical protein
VCSSDLVIFEIYSQLNDKNEELSNKYDEIKKLKFKKISLPTVECYYIAKPNNKVQIEYAIDADYPEKGKFFASFQPGFGDEDDLYNGKSLEIAKERCQKHFEKLIKSMIKL